MVSGIARTNRKRRRTGRRRAALPTKISKTTPCKVASGRWHGCFTSQNILTRRANQRHYSIVAHRPASPTSNDLCAFDLAKSPSSSIIDSTALSQDKAKQCGALFIVERTINGRLCFASVRSAPIAAFTTNSPFDLVCEIERYGFWVERSITLDGFGSGTAAVRRTAHDNSERRSAVSCLC